MDIALTDEDKHGKRDRQIQRTGCVVILITCILAAVFLASFMAYRTHRQKHHYSGGIPFIKRKETFSDIIPEKVKKSIYLRSKGKRSVVQQQLQQPRHHSHNHHAAGGPWKLVEQIKEADIRDKVKGSTAKLDHLKILNHHHPQPDHGAHHAGYTKSSKDQKEEGHQDEHESAAHHQDQDATATR
jgi:hypothetical protein